MKSYRSLTVIFGAVAALLLAILPPATASAATLDSIEDYFTDWFARATRIQSEQPHWVTPLVTVTPRLEQEVRYDQLFQSYRDGLAIDNYGNGKGLELIPYQDIEAIIGMPAWLSRNTPRNVDGFGDWPFLVKLRLLSANEEHGNYIVTAFMGFSVPTGRKSTATGTRCSRRLSRLEKVSATSMSNRRSVSRFLTAVTPLSSGSGCRWRGIPPSSITFSNFTGRSLKPTTPGSRTAATPGIERST